MLLLSLLLLATPGFRVVAYPNAEYIKSPDLHQKQVSSHNFLKPRDSQDSGVTPNIPTLELNNQEQSSSSTNQDLSSNWDSVGQGSSTNYINQDENQGLASLDLQAQACAAGPTRTNGKLRRGLSCAVGTPIKSTPQAPSMPKAPAQKPDTREDITPPKPPTPLKPLPLLIDKETGQIQLDFGPEFAPSPKYETNGPCSLRKLVCCTGELFFPFGNVENCWPCMYRQPERE